MWLGESETNQETKTTLSRTQEKNQYLNYVKKEQSFT